MHPKETVMDMLAKGTGMLVPDVPEDPKTGNFIRLLERLGRKADSKTKAKTPVPAAKEDPTA